MEKLKETNGLSLLRWIAASLVVVAHIDVKNIFPNNPTVFGYLGSFGVACFFVLSGFVMMHMNENRSLRADHFFVKRLARIMPLYLLSLLLIIGMTYLSLSWFSLPTGLSYYYRGLWLTQGCLLNAIIFRQCDNGQGLVNMIAWTLQFEILFYIIFSVGVFFKLKSYKMIGYWIGVISTIQVLGFTGVDWPAGGMLYFEFLYGLLAYVLWKKMESINRLLIIGFLFLVLGFFVSGISPYYKGGILSFGFMGVGAIFVFLSIKINGPILRFIVSELGNYSYSLYLIHWVFIPLLAYYFSIFYQVSEVSKTGLFYFLTVMLSCHLLALLVHFIFDRQVQFKLNNFLSNY